jgi:hypothetical protein
MMESRVSDLICLICLISDLMKTELEGPCPDHAVT